MGTDSTILTIGKASLEPRIVYLVAEPLGPDLVNNDTTFFDLQEYDMGPRPKLSFTSKSTVPILWVCRESRNIATKIYTLAFGGSSQPRTWFDFKNDTLHLDWQIVNTHDMEHWPIEKLLYLPEDLGEDARKVQKLASFELGYVRPWVANLDIEHIEWVEEVLAWFKDIKSMTIVDPAYQIQDSADLVELDNVVDIEGDVIFYKHYRHYPYSYELDSRLQMGEETHLAMFEHEAFPYTSSFDRLRKGQDLGRPTKVPELRFRTITSRKALEEYTQLKNLYEIQKQLHGTVITLRSSERELHRLAVQKTWTLQEVIELYREAVGISPKWKYEQTICHDEQ